MLLEVCIDSIQSAQAAKQGGADRLEICAALAAGGTTPSFGLVEQCVHILKMPSMMMIRPHDGGFVYDNDDMEVMLTNIEVAKTLGVQGVVFGCLTADRQLNIEQARELLETAEGLESTFHRAIDVMPDPLAALDQLIELGVTRVLTSGQAASAAAGTDVLRQLVQRADGRIKILAGAGVSAENAVEIVRATGVDELHASGSVPFEHGQSGPAVEFGGQRRVCCSQRIGAVKSAIADL